MRAAALALLLILPLPARAARESQAAALKNLRSNMHMAFMRSYLHQNRSLLAPAPGWLRHIGISLGRQARLGMGVNFNFYLVKVPDANAVTTPYGTIIVHQGMLDLGLTREEVGALLAHEVAHLARDHAIQRLVRSIQAAQLAIYQARRLGRDSGQLTYLQQQINNLRFNRAEEDEADAVGMLLMRKAGYKPAAMASLLEKLNGFLEAENAGKRELPPYLSSHPPTGERVLRVRSALGLPATPGELSKLPAAAARGGTYNLGFTGWQVTAPAGYKLVDSRERSTGAAIDGELHFETALEHLDERTGRKRGGTARISVLYGSLERHRKYREKSCRPVKKAKPIEGKHLERVTWRFRCEAEDGFSLDAGEASILLLLRHGGDGAKRNTQLESFVAMQETLEPAPRRAGPAKGPAALPADDGKPQRIPLLR